MSIRDFVGTESVQHLVVGRRLLTLELVDGYHSLVNRNKVRQILVVFNVYIQLRDDISATINISSD